MYFFKYKQPYFTGTEIDSKRKINHATYNRLILGSVSFGINFASYNLLLQKKFIIHLQIPYKQSV